MKKISRKKRCKKHQELEEPLIEFVRDRREKKLTVNYKVLAQEAMRLKPGAWEDFYACRSFIYGMSNRLGIFDDSDSDDFSLTDNDDC